MNDKSFKNIKNLFPDLFNEDTISVDYGDGWNDLIYELCFQLSLISKRTQLVLQVRQIKEKFGYLRFYNDFIDAEPHQKDACTFIDELIMKAELDSQQICEDCGFPGTLNRNRIWNQVLCKKCDEKNP